jgi:hypothetical protein
LASGAWSSSPASKVAAYARRQPQFGRQRLHPTREATLLAGREQLCAFAIANLRSTTSRRRLRLSAGRRRNIRHNHPLSVEAFDLCRVPLTHDQAAPSGDGVFGWSTNISQAMSALVSMLASKRCGPLIRAAPRVGCGSGTGR